MRLSLVFLIALIAFLQYKIWFDDGSISDVKRLGQELAMNKASLLEQLELNKKSRRAANKAKHSDEIAEYYARHDLGMKKKDEEYYQIIEE